MICKSKSFVFTLGCFFISAPLPARSFSVTFNLDASIGQVNNVNSEVLLNNTVKPNGFGDFFNDSFTAIGSIPNSEIPEAGSDTDVVSTAISQDIEILAADANRDLELNFDWIFQGNAIDVFEGVDSATKLAAGIDLTERLQLDTFTVSLIGEGINPSGEIVNTDLDLLVTNEYGEFRGQTFTISGGLPVGVYNVQATVIEPLQLTDEILSQIADRYGATVATAVENIYGEGGVVGESGIGGGILDITPSNDNSNLTFAIDNSAAGIDNLTISDASSSVPFEFSPTLGLFLTGSIIGFSYLKKLK